MAKDLIRYDLLVQDAMRGVMRKVLADVAENGHLPGEHHFTISFRTDAPDVAISRRLAEQWPKELTIILQHQYSNLEVDDVGFGVTLSFRSIPEHLYIPFSAVTGFFDPAVEFGLRFESGEEAGEEEETEEVARLAPVSDKPAAKPAPAKAEAGEKAKKTAPVEAEAGDAKVVSIDAFRKKT
ncbi:ClpXP protease specificity-enhancing factor SspB [Methylocystis sp. 9N]|uniref:ClpXP protease specificity-enhancing factor SspB n=1 Tax=Methylocystis borbori TaxID=3118750 RepID=A0ABU7XKP3_9HYPH